MKTSHELVRYIYHKFIQPLFKKATLHPKPPGRDPEGRGRHNEEDAQGGNGLSALAAALLGVHSRCSVDPKITWKVVGKAWGSISEHMGTMGKSNAMS